MTRIQADGSAVGGHPTAKPSAWGMNMDADLSSVHPVGGKWWLVTWTTYGTWLPGDPRGFRTWRGSEYVPPPKRYASPHEAPYRAADYSARYVTRAIKEQDAGFQPKRTWSKGCHPRSCQNERDYRTKFRYVERHRNEGATVHVWSGVIVVTDQFG